MKLIHECVRDVLLYLEENLDYNNFISASNIEIKNYSTNDIKYTLKKLSEANYITIDREDMAGNFLVYNITYYGHQFLDNIRDTTVWNKTSKILSKFSSTSLNIIENISAQVITALITNSIK